MCSWPTCNPKSASLLGKIVESPNGGWSVTNDPADAPDATLDESESGGFCVDEFKMGTGAVELPQKGPMVGVFDPDLSTPIGLTYSPLLLPDWSDC